MAATTDTTGQPHWTTTSAIRFTRRDHMTAVQAHLREGGSPDRSPRAEADSETHSRRAETA
jgi:hypothetical protein